MRSSLLEAHTRLEHQARHDGLTGLANRVLFHERLREAIKEARSLHGSVALLYIDCDNFKTINDSLGHDAGDLFLKQRAECLGSCLRPGDTLARLGGDEFAIVLPDVGSAAEAINIGNRILGKLGESFRLMGQEVFGSASIGVHCSEAREEITADAMLRDADTAMYHVKAEGKAGVGLFNQTMKDRVNEQMEIEAGLQRALERNELYVVYQPLVDLNTGDIAGAEALLRWSQPERGNITPGRFIPIAEESGLIVPIGAWVLEQACRQAVEWRQQLGKDSPFKISVNISGKQFQRPDAEEQIMRTLALTGLPAPCLELEITETIMLKSLTEAGRKANKLRKSGIRLALDDFGTGYSSMASLIELPVDTIKIDRTFIHRMSTLEQVKATVAAIVALAKAYGMEVVAEGIESEADVSTLQGYGCNFGQGYYFAKPLEAEQMSELLSRGPRAFARKLEESHSNLVESLLERVVQEQNRAA
jgi:diguanylate cyclase (GGDEF) domain